MMDDYASYLQSVSEDELADISRNIDREKFPGRFKVLTREIEVRRSVKKHMAPYDIIVDNKVIIDPLRYGTDTFYTAFLTIFWLIWAPITGVMTYMAITDPHFFFYVWLIFGYLGTFGIPVALISKNRVHVIECVDDSLLVHGTGFWPSSEITIEKSDLRALTLEHYNDNDHESVFSLNLICDGPKSSKRVMLAPFVHPRDKHGVFLQIEKFLRHKGFEFTASNKLPDKSRGRWPMMH